MLAPEFVDDTYERRKRNYRQRPELGSPEGAAKGLEGLGPGQTADLVDHAHLEDVEGRRVEQTVQRDLVEDEGLAAQLGLSAVEELEPHVTERAAGSTGS